MEDQQRKQLQSTQDKSVKEIISKYKKSVYAQQANGDSYNPEVIKKQKMALKIELKRNAHRVSKYLKDSETISGHVKTYIDSFNTAEQYVDSEPIYNKSQRESKFAQRDKDLLASPDQIERSKNISPFTLGLSVKSIESKRTTEANTSIDRDTLENISLKKSTLPELTMREYTTTYTQPSAKSTVVTKKDNSTKLALKIKEIEEKSPRGISLTRTELSPAPNSSRDQIATTRSVIEHYLRKYSPRRKGNPVEVYKKASRASIKLMANNDYSGYSARKTPFEQLYTDVDSFNTIMPEKKSTTRTDDIDSYGLKKIPPQSLILPQISKNKKVKTRYTGSPQPQFGKSEKDEKKPLKFLKEIYTSCDKLVSKLNFIDKKLSDKEIMMNKHYSDIQIRLDKVRDCNFLPQEMILHENLI